MPVPVKVLGSVLLLVLVIIKIDVTALVSNLAGSDIPLLLLALALAFVAWLINTLKWQMLLGTTSQGLRYLVLVRLTFIGHFYNLLVPGRFGGEVVKSVRLAQLGIAPSAAAMSVVADRVTGSSRYSRLVPSGSAGTSIGSWGP